METVGPAPAVLKPSGELVDDNDLAFPHHVIFVTQLGDVGGQGVLDVVDQVEVLWIVQVPYLAPLLHLADAFLAQGDGLGPLVDGVVFLDVEAGSKFGEGVVVLHRLFRWSADDEGGPSLVDEDIVDFVHDGEVQFSLYPLGGFQRHVVPQIIEAEFVVSAVGDVGSIGFAPADGAHGLERFRGSASRRSRGFFHFRVEQIRGIMLEAGYG